MADFQHLTRDAASAIIANMQPFSAVADELAMMLVPTGVKVAPIEGDTGPTDSYFGGGEPLMLPEHDWPARTHEPYLGRDPSSETFTLPYGEPERIPLTFLAQINLAQVPREVSLPLPPDGLLSFFVDPHVYGGDPKEQEAFRLFHVPASRFDELRPRRMPTAPTAGVFPVEPLPKYRMAFALNFLLPPQAEIEQRLPSLRLTPEAYDRLTQRLAPGHNQDGLFTNLHSRGDDPRIVAEEGSGGISLWDQAEASGKSYEEAIDQVMQEWRVLFSMSSIDELRLPGTLWHLCWVIRQSDLDAGRFDRYWGSASN